MTSSPAAGSGASEVRAPLPGYENWTKDELYDKAEEVGIEGRSDMTKDELIDALRGRN